MRAVEATVGMRGTDSVTKLNQAMASNLKNAGMDFAVQYLGSVNAQGVADILSAGLLFCPVTYGDQFNGPTTVTELGSLGLPSGISVWLDVESVHSVTAAALISEINAWGDAVNNAGYIPGLYSGPGALLTSTELYDLHVRGYWRSQSIIADRYNVLAMPACGYQMFQCFPSLNVAGVNVDIDFVQKDYHNRLPYFVSA
jgi:hypothetical protein